MKIDWDRYVDEDEEEEGFDTSAVSFVFLYICLIFSTAILVIICSASLSGPCVYLCLDLFPPQTNLTSH